MSAAPIKSRPALSTVAVQKVLVSGQDRCFANDMIGGYLIVEPISRDHVARAAATALQVLVDTENPGSDIALEGVYALSHLPGREIRAIKLRQPLRELYINSVLGRNSLAQFWREGKPIEAPPPAQACSAAPSRSTQRGHGLCGRF